MGHLYNLQVSVCVRQLCLSANELFFGLSYIIAELVYLEHIFAQHPGFVFPIFVRRLILVACIFVREQSHRLPIPVQEPMPFFQLVFDWPIAPIVSATPNCHRGQPYYEDYFLRTHTD